MTSPPNGTNCALPFPCPAQRFGLRGVNRPTDHAITRSFGTASVGRSLVSRTQQICMEHPATKKRGADPEVPHKSAQEKPDDIMERKLEQGLEESMAGSDPVSITQPPP